MSKSLIKKSLELLESGSDIPGDKQHKKKKKQKSSGVLDLIPINHRLITKNKGSRALLNRSSKVTVSDAKKELLSRVDPTEDNVRKLLAFSAYSFDAEKTEKIISRAVNKRYIIEKPKPVEEEKTVFTEEDFQKFEKEYFG